MWSWWRKVESLEFSFMNNIYLLNYWLGNTFPQNTVLSLDFYKFQKQAKDYLIENQSPGVSLWEAYAMVAY